MCPIRHELAAAADLDRSSSRRRLSGERRLSRSGLLDGLRDFFALAAATPAATTLSSTPPDWPFILASCWSMTAKASGIERVLIGSGSAGPGPLGSAVVHATRWRSSVS